MQSTAAHAVLAVVHRAAEGGYRAKVPSMPDCASQAESLASLITLAFSGVIDAAAAIPA